MYNAAMGGCIQGGQPELARRLLVEMKDLGLRPNATSYSTLVNACAGPIGDPAGGQTGGQTCDAAAPPAAGAPEGEKGLIGQTGGQAEEGWRWGGELAVELLREMEAAGLQPDQALLLATSAACDASGMAEAALRLRDRASSQVVVSASP